MRYFEKMHVDIHFRCLLAQCTLIIFLIVHELGPKKWVFGSGGWTKHNIDF